MENDLLLVAGAAASVTAGAAWLLWRIRRRADGRKPTDRLSARSGEVGLVSGLAKTRRGLLSRLRAVLNEERTSDEGLAEMEQALLVADVGVKTTQQLLSRLRSSQGDRTEGGTLREVLRREMLETLGGPAPKPADEKPHVILVAGVNGVGKTTSIGKLAHLYVTAGKKVILVAADTFRAAAVEQLLHWAQRVGAECVHHKPGADPSAVVYDGIAAGLSRGADIVIIDTAGRLHVKQHLVEELRKIARVVGRQISGAPHEVLLVLDATTGQNALSQARVFQEALSLTGIVLTKLDGSAKGGVIFAIWNEVGVPVRYVGVGEDLEDLRPFEPDRFVDALLSAEHESGESTDPGENADS